MQQIKYVTLQPQHNWMWPGSDILWGASTHKVTEIFKHLVPWDHVIHQKCFLPNTTVLEAIKLAV